MKVLLGLLTAFTTMSCCCISLAEADCTYGDKIDTLKTVMEDYNDQLVNMLRNLSGLENFQKVNDLFNSNDDILIIMEKASQLNLEARWNNMTEEMRNGIREFHMALQTVMHEAGISNWDLLQSMCTGSDKDYEGNVTCSCIGKDTNVKLVFSPSADTHDDDCFPTNCNEEEGATFVNWEIVLKLYYCL